MAGATISLGFIQPPGGAFSGPHGGPFSPASLLIDASRTNPSGASNWSIYDEAGVLDFNPSSGNLSFLETVYITITPNPDAYTTLIPTPPHLPDLPGYSDQIYNITIRCNNASRSTTFTINPITGLMEVPELASEYTNIRTNYQTKPTTEFEISITNISEATFTWSISTNVNWLDSDVAGGTLYGNYTDSPFCSAIAILSFTESVTQLEPGNHVATISVLNLTTPSQHTDLTINLTVLAPPHTSNLPTHYNYLGRTITLPSIEISADGTRIVNNGLPTLTINGTTITNATDSGIDPGTEITPTTTGATVISDNPSPLDLDVISITETAHGATIQGQPEPEIQNGKPVIQGRTVEYPSSHGSTIYNT